MRSGVAMFVTDETAASGDFGRVAEDRGFEALFVPEHTHMPLDHRPYADGGEIPRRCARALDAFVVLTAAAAKTSKLRLGFGIAPMVQRDPILTAKAVASLDVVSGGRVEFGVGAGWHRPEVEHHGTDRRARFGVLRDRVEAMRVLWNEEVASYEGRHVRSRPSWSWPKPVHRPLPVLVGGNGPKVLDRVLRYGDGWMPNRERDLPRRIAELRRRAADAGRPRPEATHFGATRDLGTVERLASAGVDRVLPALPTGRGRSRRRRRVRPPLPRRPVT